MDSWQMVQAALAMLFTVVAAVTDLRTRKVPNKLTVPAFGLAVVFHLIRGIWMDGWMGMWGGWRTGGLVFSLAGFATGFGVLFVLWLIGGGGGGDVKLMGAVGAWLGTILTFQVFLASVLFVIVGSGLTMALSFMNRGVEKTKRRYLTKPAAEARNTKNAQDARVHRRLLPFGVPVALATWSVMAYHFFQSMGG